MKKWSIVATIGAVAALVAVGCGDDDKDSSSVSGGKTTSITVATPFPGCSSFFPIYAAIDQGYFRDEGLKVSVEPLEGSGSVLPVVAAGRAQVGVASPGPFMRAVEKGSDLKSFYTLNQSEVYSLVVPEDSDIESLADLKDKKVGVSAPNSGDGVYAKSLLSEGAGLKNGDYELVTVGGGGPAVVAIDRGEIDAYSDSYPDIATMRQRGLKLRALTDPDYPKAIDGINVAETEWIDKNKEAVEGYAHALQKATKWGFDHKQEIVDLCGEVFPDESSDNDFALAILNEVIAISKLPDEADGKYGYQPLGAIKRNRDFLVRQGTLRSPVSVDVFTNEYL